MTTPMNSPTSDQLHASAIYYLFEKSGRDKDARRAAIILLACEPSFTYTQRHDKFHAEITLRAPEMIYRWLHGGFQFSDRHTRGSNEDEDIFIDPPFLAYIYSLIEDAFKAVLPAEVSTLVIYPRAALIAINPQWRQELSDTLHGKQINNQGLPLVGTQPLHTWHNLRFRSQTEIRIAEALERVERPPVLFLPNCMARLGFSQRENREADFLICQKGKWGILEVDGSLSHPASRKVDDDERARLFKAHGIRLVEHFDAGECWENPDGVVKRFLYLLGQ